jgi:predicted RNase H-like nuclease (RuvC/YqgF family)
VPTDDLNIEYSLSFSEQQDGLIQGHQTEMQQVLADKQHLRTIIRSQNEVIAQLKQQIAQLQQENADKDKTIERLNAENELFRTTTTQPRIVHIFTQPQNNTTYNVHGDYIAKDKHVGAHIDNVSPGAIGAQTTKD